MEQTRIRQIVDKLTSLKPDEQDVIFSVIHNLSSSNPEFRKKITHLSEQENDSRTNTWQNMSSKLHRNTYKTHVSNRDKKKEYDRLRKEGVNFLWSFSDKIKKVKMELKPLDIELVTGKIGTELYKHLKKDIIARAGSIKQKYNKLPGWVVAYKVDKKTGNVVWGGSKWYPENHNMVLTKDLKFALKMWAVDRMTNSPRTINYPIPEDLSIIQYGVKKVQKGKLFLDPLQKKGISLWYRSLEDVIKKRVYVDGFN